MRSWLQQRSPGPAPDSPEPVLSTTVTVTTRITRAERDWVTAQASIHGTTPSGYLRELVLKEMKHLT